MNAATDSIAVDRAVPFRIGTEERFPLDLTSSSPVVWDAYEQALTEAWDPEDDSLWGEFDPSSHDPDTRRHAALVWSHRAWVEFPAIAESEAVLIRACLEPGVGIDFKYCMSMRAVERARSTDLAHLVASRLDGYVSTPPGSRVSELLDAELVRRALHAETDLEGYVAAHIATQAVVDLRLWERAAHNSEPGLAALVRLVTRDKARMADVAWHHLAESLAGADEARRRRVADTVTAVVELEELAGRQVPALLGPGVERDQLVTANEIAATAQLGGLTESEQLEVATAALAEASARLGEIGLDVALPSVARR